MNDKEQNPESGCNEPRRDVLKGIGAAIAVGLANLTPQAAAPATREFPGWRGGAPEIWAYTERMSYTAGERVDLRVHTTGRTFAVKIDRDGYPAKTVLQKDGTRGTRQHRASTSSWSRASSRGQRRRSAWCSRRRHTPLTTTGAAPIITAASARACPPTCPSPCSRRSVRGDEAS